MGLRAAPHPPAIFLMGPTASGKTALAIEICQRMPCEIISVDSALIYRDMNIGTAKPTAAELALAPHRLIDICDPAESYSASRFREDALGEMAAITRAGRIPLLVGGTMLYFKTLLEGIADLPSADPAIREQIRADAAKHGWPYIHAQLAAVDPQAAARLHPNHSQRLERALEVYRLSGITLSEWHCRQQEQPFPYRTVQLALLPAQREKLYQRIEKRFMQMLEQGLLAEVTALYQRGDLDIDLPSMRAVGYRQLWEYLQGDCDYAQMCERGIAATRQLARRQLTWLKRWPRLQCLYVDEQSRLVQLSPTGTPLDRSLGQPLSTGVLNYLTGCF